jgi:prolipoprotein diacylglyceryltransferase
MLWVLDRLVIPSALAAFFIRLGNFLNSEIIGKPTESDWGVVFVRLGEDFPRHPAQLYEAICYLVIFGLLYYAYHKIPSMLKKGRLFGAFLAVVFTARFCIEFVKKSQGGFEDVLALNLSTGQLLSIPFVLIGVYFWFFRKSEINQ